MIRSNGTYSNALNNRNFAQMLEEINFNLQSFPLTSASSSNNNNNNLASNLNANSSSSNQNNGHIGSNLSSNPQPSSIVGHSSSNLIQAQFLHGESSSQQNQAAPSYHIRYQQPSSISSRYENSSYQRFSNNTQAVNEPSSSTNTRKKQNSSPKIQDILTCLICFGKLKNAHMCPDCQKMCCESCIKQWLSSKSHCPHCRSHLRPSNLMKCRFVNEITTALEKIEQIEQKKEKQGICEEHDNPLLYYCQICKHPVCSDCGMIGSQHRNHKFDKLNSVYDTHVKQVRQELSAVKKKLQELNKQQQDVDVVIEKITQMKDEKASSLTQQMDYVNIKLNDLLKSKLEKLSLQRGPISEEIDLLENMSEEINEYIETLPKSILISKSGEIVKTLEEINSRRVIKNFISDNEKKLEFLYDIIPPYDSADYFLQNYSVKRKSANVSYSETLYAHGNEWRLKVYLNGKDKAKDSFLSVFVEMTKGSVKPSNFEYRVEMINQVNPDLRVTREFISPFETGATWGYEKFFKLSQLESEGYLLPESDMLIFKYYVRSPSYSQFCQSKQNRIEELESQNQLLQEEIKQLKESQNHPKNSQVDFSNLQVSEQLKFEGINESKADNFELETFINEVENGSISNIRSQLENYLKQKALEEFAKSDTEGDLYENNQDSHNNHEDIREGDYEHQDEDEDGDENDNDNEEEEEEEDHEENNDDEQEDDQDGSSEEDQAKFDSQNYIENLREHQDDDSLYDNEVDEYQYKCSNNNQNKEFMEKIIKGEHKACVEDYENDDKLENNQSEPMEYDSFIDELAAKKLKRKQELEFMEQQNLKEELELNINSIAKDIQDILKQDNNNKSQYNNFKVQEQMDNNKKDDYQDELDLYCKMEEEILLHGQKQQGANQNKELSDNQLVQSYQFRDKEISAILQGSKLTDRNTSQNEDKSNYIQQEQSLTNNQQQSKDNDYRLRWNGIMQNVSQALKSGDSSNTNQNQQLINVNPYSLKTNLLQQNKKEAQQDLEEDQKNGLHLLEESKIDNDNDEKLVKSTQESDFPDIYMMLDDIGDKVQFVPVSQLEIMNENSIMIKKNLLPEFEQEALRIEEKKLEVQQQQLHTQQQKIRSLMSTNSAASTPTQPQLNIKNEKNEMQTATTSTRSKYLNCEEQAFQSVKTNSYQPTFSQYQQQQQQQEQAIKSVSNNQYKDKNALNFDSFMQRYENQFKSETTYSTRPSEIVKNEGVNNLKSDRLYTYQLNTNKTDGKESLTLETQQFKYNFKKSDPEQSQPTPYTINEKRRLSNSISVQSLQVSQNNQSVQQVSSKRDDFNNLLGQFTNPTLSKLVASHQKEQEEQNKPLVSKNSTTPINSILQNNFTSSTASFVNKKIQNKNEKSEQNLGNDDLELEINDLLEKENKDDSLLAMEKQIQKLEMMNKIEEEQRVKNALANQRILQSKDQPQLKQPTANTNSQQHYSDARKQLISSINFSEDFLKKINKVKQYGNIASSSQQGENSIKNKQQQKQQNNSNLQSSSSLTDTTNNQQSQKSQQKHQEQSVNTHQQPNSFLNQSQQENQQSSLGNTSQTIKNESPVTVSEGGSEIKQQEEEIKKLENLVVEQTQENENENIN